ncbi:MAG: hypothetical protein OXJ52_10120 [Oligoflexia bacterium]|nr:hypothetical protein [Oligoflexia bacterium]
MSIFLGGSWNVAFIREYTLDPKNNVEDTLESGTIAHELTHTLGQGRELYEKTEDCQTFRGSPLKPCDKYKIPMSLDAWFQGNKQHWGFLKNRYSIVNSKGTIQNQWIDRETYQKALWTLSNVGSVIPKDYELFGKNIVLYKRASVSSVKAVVSGFYNEKENAFVVSKTKLFKTKLITPSFPNTMEGQKTHTVTFQFKEKNKLIKEIKRPIFKMQIKTLYKNKPPKTEPFDYSHTMAGFIVPVDSDKRNLRIDVLSPKGDLIYSAPVPKRKKQRKQLREGK